MKRCAAVAKLSVGGGGKETKIQQTKIFFTFCLVIVQTLKLSFCLFFVLCESMTGNERGLGALQHPTSTLSSWPSEQKLYDFCVSP